MLGELITSKTRLRLLIKFFVSQANRGYLNGLATEMGESTNSIRKELNHLHDAGYLQKEKSNNTLKGDLVKNTFLTSSMNLCNLLIASGIDLAVDFLNLNFNRLSHEAVSSLG